MARCLMSRGLYPEDRWKDVPKDFWSFEGQPDGVPWTSHFFAQFTSRIGYTVGATLVDPVAFAQWLHIPDEQLPAIVAFLERHGFLSIGTDGSLTLSERGEQRYGCINEFHQQMMWSTDEPVWRKDIGSIRDTNGFAVIAGKLNEHHAPMMRQFAVLLAAEAIQYHSAECLRLGILAAALAVSVANDGARPDWVPSIEEIGETLASLSQTSAEIGLDPKDEFAAIARMLSGNAITVISEFAGHD